MLIDSNIESKGKIMKQRALIEIKEKIPSVEYKSVPHRGYWYDEYKEKDGPNSRLSMDSN
jgi:hypothetical protein